MKKQILSITLAGIISFMLTGCNNNSPKTENTESSQDAGTVITEASDNPAVVEQDTDDDNDMNTGNMISVENLEVGKYKVTNEGNKVMVSSNDGSCIKTISYVYNNNNSLNNIEIIQKYSSAELAKIAYDKLKAEPESMQVYEDIKLDGEIIKITSSIKQVEALKSLTQQQLYEQQKAMYSKAN